MLASRSASDDGRVEGALRCVSPPEPEVGSLLTTVIEFALGGAERAAGSPDPNPNPSPSPNPTATPTPIPTPTPMPNP